MPVTIQNSEKKTIEIISCNENTPSFVLEIEKNKVVEIVAFGNRPGPPGPKGEKGNDGELKQTFEIISQNILDWDKNYYYDYNNGGVLTKIEYSLSGDSVLKNFTYSGDNLINCLLSGNDLSGIKINKNFVYNASGDLDSILYTF
jgi:hypothetical protein